MLYSRATAAFCTLLLIGIVSLVTIGLVGGIGPLMAHGSQAQHLSGKLQPGNKPLEYVLVTSSGQKYTIECTQHCLKQTSHIQRHIIEKANTDVYFLPGANDTLTAIDVD